MKTLENKFKAIAVSKFEPYQCFFLSGLLISILGVGSWIAFQLNWIAVFPISAHANLMIAGFLFSYIFGFLMTAVPKMSQTAEASTSEVVLGLLGVWAQVAVAFTEGTNAYILCLLQLVFLLFFICRRFLVKKANPPMGFIFVPFGILVGICGCLLLLSPISEFPELYRFGKNLIYQAVVLNLILGLGSRLIPTLSRVQGAIDIRSASTERIGFYLVMGLVLNSAFVIESFLSANIGNIIKFLVIAVMAFYKFKIFHPKQVNGFLGFGLRTSVHLLACGFLLTGLFPDYTVHFMHLVYIGGFALLTIMVSTRVVLSHGQHNLSFELIDKNIKWFVYTFLIVAIMRASLGFAGAYRNHFIVLLFLGWLVGCAFWSRSYLLKMIFTNRN